MEVVTTLFVNNPKIATRVFGFPFSGLCEGSVADVVMIDYEPPTPLDSNTYFGHLVFGISQAMVDTTIVGGKVLMQNKKLAFDVDEERVNARSRELAKELWQKL
jgi:cytosine/adenosine deaminase-related metal-dependent hydrolase